jgi:large subunit ribosomal protein L35Ae
MQGLIVSYRRSQRNITPDQAIVTVDGIKNRDEASKLIGKAVSWKSVKTTISGKVASPHGNSGALRVAFEKGLPGQAITQTVDIQ